MKKKKLLKQSKKLLNRKLKKSGKSRALPLYRAGRLAEAAQASVEELAADPGSPSALYVQGAVAWHRGELLLAQESLRSAIAARPDFGEAYFVLGCVRRSLGAGADSVKAFRKALELGPETPLLHNVLGNALKENGELAEGISHYRRALALDGNYLLAHYNLAIALRLTGELLEAISSFRKVLALDPEYYMALDNLGTIHDDLGEFDSAMDCYQKSLKIKTDNPVVYNNLANVLRRIGRLREAEVNCRKALELERNFGQAYKNLGLIQQEQGLARDSLDSYRMALACGPDQAIFSNLLFSLNYFGDVSQEEILAESRLWAEKFEVAGEGDVTRFQNSPEPDRRLRIGYVSPDFKDHSVAYFIDPVLRNHDRSQVEVYCYANVFKPDRVTERIMNRVENWRDIVNLNDHQAAELIRQDRIDILVDLAGHSGGNRLTVFGLRTAPVQLTWLGYPNTTGMKSIDYRLTDVVADPPGQADELHTEKLLRLDRGFLCYQPEPDAPDVGGLPARQAGYPTFGSFNNLTKITPEVVEVWAGILTALPGSRLILKNRALAHEQTADLYRRMFVERGVEIDRLDMLGMLPAKGDHLGLYKQVDIALDPFPYNGTTTTCEALWMGVPVIALRGRRHSGRVGASIMQQVGLPELVAESLEDYVSLAKGLAEDIDRLEAFRENLRVRLQNSPLLDQAGFTSALESAYRKIWHQWCDGRLAR